MQNQKQIDGLGRHQEGNINEIRKYSAHSIQSQQLDQDPSNRIQNNNKSHHIQTNKPKTKKKISPNDHTNTHIKQLTKSKIEERKPIQNNTSKKYRTIVDQNYNTQLIMLENNIVGDTPPPNNKTREYIETGNNSANENEGMSQQKIKLKRAVSKYKKESDKLKEENKIMQDKQQALNLCIQLYVKERQQEHDRMVVLEKKKKKYQQIKQKNKHLKKNQSYLITIAKYVKNIDQMIGVPFEKFQLNKERFKNQSQLVNNSDNAEYGKSELLECEQKLGLLNTKICQMRQKNKKTNKENQMFKKSEQKLKLEIEPQKQKKQNMAKQNQELKKQIQGKLQEKIKVLQNEMQTQISRKDQVLYYKDAQLQELNQSVKSYKAKGENIQKQLNQQKIKNNTFQANLKFQIQKNKGELHKIIEKHRSQLLQESAKTQKLQQELRTQKLVSFNLEREHKQIIEKLKNKAEQFLKQYILQLKSKYKQLNKQKNIFSKYEYNQSQLSKQQKQIKGLSQRLQDRCQRLQIAEQQLKQLKQQQNNQNQQIVNKIQQYQIIISQQRQKQTTFGMAQLQSQYKQLHQQSSQQINRLSQQNRKLFQQLQQTNTAGSKLIQNIRRQFQDQRYKIESEYVQKNRQTAKRLEDQFKLNLQENKLNYRLQKYQQNQMWKQAIDERHQIIQNITANKQQERTSIIKLSQTALNMNYTIRQMKNQINDIELKLKSKETQLQFSQAIIKQKNRQLEELNQANVKLQKQKRNQQNIMNGQINRMKEYYQGEYLQQKSQITKNLNQIFDKQRKLYNQNLNQKIQQLQISRFVSETKTKVHEIQLINLKNQYQSYQYQNELLRVELHQKQKQQLIKELTEDTKVLISQKQQWIKQKQMMSNQLEEKDFEFHQFMRELVENKYFQLYKIEKWQFGQLNKLQKIRIILQAVGQRDIIARDQIEQLKLKLNDSQTKLEVSETQIVELEVIKQSLEFELGLKETACIKSQQKYKSNTKQLIQMKETMKDYEDVKLQVQRMKNIQNQKKVNEIMLKKEKEQKTQIYQRMDQLTSKINELQRQLKEKDEKIKQIEGTHQQLGAAVKNEMNASFANLEVELQIKNRSINEMNRRNTILQQENQQLATSNSKIKEEITAIKKEIDAVTAKFEQSDHKIAEQLQCIYDLQENNKKLKESLSIKVRQQSIINEQKHQQNQEQLLLQLQNRVQQLQQQKLQLKQQLQNIKEQKQQNELLQQKQMLQIQNRDFKEQIKIYQKQVKNYKTMIETRDREIKTLQLLAKNSIQIEEVNLNHKKTISQSSILQMNDHAQDEGVFHCSEESIFRGERKINILDILKSNIKRNVKAISEVYRMGSSKNIFIDKFNKKTVAEENKNYIFLFQSNLNIFGVIAYFEPNYQNRQIILFNLLTKIVVTKKQKTNQSVPPFRIESSNSLCFDYTLIKLQSGSRILAMKQPGPLSSYFKTFNRIDIFGKQSCRQQQFISLNQFQIHELQFQ